MLLLNSYRLDIAVAVAFEQEPILLLNSYKLDIICSHTAEIYFNDLLQLTILMIVTLTKH
jgi:hypothetical protein